MANLLFGISLFSLLFLWFFIPPLFCILVIFHYFWSLCIYQCLFLKIKNSYKALIILCLLALLWASGLCVYRFNIQWFADNELVFILFVCGFFTMPIYLLSFYFNSGGFNNKNTLINILKKTLKNEALVKEINVKFFFAFSLLITLTSIWQLEVPQRLIVNLLPVKLEIVNDDFEYVENPVQRFSAFIESNLDFKEEKTKRFLNFTYSKNNIYVCDSFDCKGDKKYVGFYWEPWSYASTLGCIYTIINTGSCMRSIDRNKRGRDYLMSFIENRKIK